MEFYIIRHGETDWNKLFLIQGRTNNPLNNTGKLQAKKLGIFFHNKNIHFDYIYASPLLRAVQTAEIIANEVNFDGEIHTSNYFIERDFGELDGKDVNDETLYIMRNDLFKTGENNLALEKRVRRGLDDLTSKYRDKRILIVTHSHTLKAILTQFDPQITYTTKVLNTSINIIKYQNESYSITLFNNKKHL